MAQIEESVARYLRQLDSADRQEPLPGAHDDLANAVAGALTLAALGRPA